MSEKPESVEKTRSAGSASKSSSASTATQAGPQPVRNVAAQRAAGVRPESGTASAAERPTSTRGASAVEDRPAFQDRAETGPTREAEESSGANVSGLLSAWGAPSSTPAGQETRGVGDVQEVGEAAPAGDAAKPAATPKIDGAQKPGDAATTDPASQAGKTDPKSKLTDQKLSQLKSQVASLSALIDSLSSRKGSMSKAQFSDAVDQARVGLDMVSAALDGKEYRPEDFQSRFGNLISSWRQTTEGNCASVATIKAAMHKWGDRVFQNQQRSADGGYDITMRDGYKLHVNPQELETARRMSDFEGTDQKALNYANLVYAAMAKRALENGHEGARTFARAAHSLNNGETVDYPAKLLGISDHLRRIPVSQIRNSDIVMAWNQNHMVYGTDGRIDAYGRPVGTGYFGLTGAYELV